MNRSTLTPGQSFWLCRLIEDEYTTKGVTDSDFAKYAESQLKFSVTQAQVMKRRDELGIASTWRANAAKRREEEALKKHAENKKTSSLEVIRNLQERVLALETKLAVNHIDGNKLNNTKDNLEAITAQLNQKHAHDTGLRNKESYAHLGRIDNSGMNNGMAKLSSEDVMLYRMAFDSNILSIKEISKKTGMRRKSITDMLNSRTYKNVAYRITRSTWFEEN